MRSLSVRLAISCVLVSALGLAACAPDETSPDGGTTPTDTGPGSADAGNNCVAPRVVSFTTATGTISSGSSVELRWNVEKGADDPIEIAADPGGVIIDTTAPIRAENSGNLDADTVFTLTVTSLCGAPEATATAMVKVQSEAEVNIVSFTAMPEPVIEGNQVRLSWVTENATDIEVQVDGQVVRACSGENPAAGSCMSGPITADTEATLVAQGSGGPVMRSVNITTQPEVPTATVAPNVSFSATPPGWAGPPAARTYDGESVTVDVQWATRGADTVALDVDGQPLPGAEDMLNGQVQHTTSELVTTYSIDARNSAGQTNRSILVYRLREKEPNDSVATATPFIPPAVGSTMSGSIEAGDVDRYSVTVPMGGWIEVTTQFAGCPNPVDVALIDGMGQQVTDSTGGGCSAIDPTTDARAANLMGGTYLVQVTSTSLGPYRLQILTGSPGCGNNIIEPPEECDGGPNCNASCMLTIPTLMGPGTGGQEVTRNWNESLLANETDTYQIVIGPGRAYLSAQTYVPAFQQCASGADTTLVLDDASNRTVIQTGTGPGNSNCAAIDPMTNSAALLDPGTYRLRVRHATGAAIPAYELRVQIVGEICGNGFVENAGLPMGEECDDRNTMSMDGCSSTCRFEGAREVEPNDAFGTATTVGQNPATTLGALTTSDEDYYRIVIPANVHLEAFVTTNGRTTCDNTRLMRLNLFDTDGQLVLATNLNGGPGGFCGRIDPSIAPVASRLPAGTYYLSVTEDLDRDVPLYYLHTNLVTASCGNGYLDANEECDDGNTTATDGCDSMCRLTVAAGTTSPPGGTVMGSLPASGVTAFRVNIPTGGMAITATVTGCAGSNLSLLDASFERLGQSDFPSFCAGLNFRVHPFARDLAAGDHYLLLENRATTAVMPQVQIGFVNPACGNFVPEFNAGEQCDDGNQIAGDGCGPSCMLENTVASESEGNDTRATADDSTLSGQGVQVVAGRITSPGDIDYWSFTVPAGPSRSVVATTYGSLSSLSSCGGDTRVALVDSTGQVLREDNDGGFGQCSMLALGNLGAGTYYLRVHHNTFGSRIPVYYMTIQVQ